jgi:hypothetical protein
MAAEGLLITFEEEYYDRLCVDKKVRVQFLDDCKGKCLVARVPIAEEETVLQEKNRVVAQNLEDRVERIPVCHSCMKSLETPAAVCIRVHRKVAQDSQGRRPTPPFYTSKLPYAASLPSLPKPVPCRNAVSHGCEEAYCSVPCEEEGWNRHHAVVCPGTTGIRMDADHPLSKLMVASWLQGNINYTDTVWVAAVILTHVLCDVRVHGRSPREAWLPFSFFISVPWEFLSFEYLLTDEDEAKGPAETKDQFVARLGRSLETVFHPTKEERFLFEADFLSRLLGMILLNGQERTPPSHFLEYCTYASDTFKNLARTDFPSVVLGAKTSDEDKDLLNYSFKGQGIYTVGACMNHSCEPNVYVSYSKDNDEELVVVAHKAIPAGAELCISYIDEDADVEERQAQLWHHYRFHCRCGKCVRELAARAASPPPKPLCPKRTSRGRAKDKKKSR